ILISVSLAPVSYFFCANAWLDKATKTTAAPTAVRSPLQSIMSPSSYGLWSDQPVQRFVCPSLGEGGSPPHCHGSWCGGSEARIRIAASSPCGLLNQSHTRIIDLPVSFEPEVRKASTAQSCELRARDTSAASTSQSVAG